MKLHGKIPFGHQAEISASVLGLRTPPENMVHMDSSGLNGSKVKELHSGYSEHIFAHFPAVIVVVVALVVVVVVVVVVITDPVSICICAFTRHLLATVSTNGLFSTQK